MDLMPMLDSIDALDEFAKSENVHCSGDVFGGKMVMRMAFVLKLKVKGEKRVL